MPLDLRARPCPLGVCGITRPGAHHGEVVCRVRVEHGIRFETSESADPVRTAPSYAVTDPVGALGELDDAQRFLAQELISARAREYGTRLGEIHPFEGTNHLECDRCGKSAAHTGYHEPRRR